MKPRHEDQTPTQSQTKAGKPRFRIEKLEERIAPACGFNKNGHQTGGPHCRFSK